DPGHTLQKNSLTLMRAEAPLQEQRIKMKICKAGVFEDLAQILEGKWEGYTAEVVCAIVDGLLKDNKDGLEYGLTSKMINGLKKVLSVDQSKIKKFHLAALARYTVYGSDEQRDELYKMNVLPVLAAQFTHPDKLVVADAVIAVNNLVLGGARLTDSELPHPYLETMDQRNLDGVTQLYKIFRSSTDDTTKRNAAICIGRLYKALPLPRNFSR
ncbi:MAG: hypothetical protein EZS28_045445, partial [Streblomastix strix]